MSSLAGRLAAGKEGAYFFQETKRAVDRLAQKNPRPLPSSPPLPNAASSITEESQADVLPEVLRHSLPPEIYKSRPLDSSLSNPKWMIQYDLKNASSVSKDALHPLRAYTNLPQVTFGASRWKIPEKEFSASVSTANELRRDRGTLYVNPEKLKALAEGYATIGKSFAIATAIVFGGAALIFSLVATKLEIHNTDDIRIKVSDLVQPKSEILREQLNPIRTWVENTGKRWHLEKEEEMKDKPFIKELSKVFGGKASS